MWPRASRIRCLVRSHGQSLSVCVAERCKGHMEVESHGDADELSSPCGTAVGCWRAEDAVPRHGQVLHPWHLCHSSSAGTGHPGMAGLQMLHTEKYLKSARCW